MNPTAIYDVAQTALECVCDQMDSIDEEDYPGCPCWRYVSAGPPTIDCCTSDCKGMLTVHVESVYPSGVFPGPLDGFEPCKAATWVAVLVVTAARCVSMTDEEGDPPTIEELNASGRLLAIDQYAILTALGCCLVADAPSSKRLRRVSIGETLPQTSEGGCASVEVRALVEVGPVCGCTPAS